MIVVRVELHSAVTGEVAELGVAVIDNQGVRRGGKIGDYRARVARKGGGLQGALSVPLRTGEVTNYPRLSYNVWRLVMRALKSCFPEEA